MDLALVTCCDIPEPDWDLPPLCSALASAGISHHTVAWDDPSVDWSAARLTLLRSTWNYPRKSEAFAAWLRATAQRSALWNPLPVLEWNLHKAYLLELERRGVPVAPTELVPRGAATSLATICAQRGWSSVVVKPAVSAGSHRTAKVERDDIERGERHLRALAADGDVLVQGYLPSVEDHGERCLVWIDGTFTHAVRKQPRFVGDDESVTPVAIGDAERDVAEAALAVVGERLLYARVDVAPGLDGTPLVMELELLEPSLFFAHGPAALARLVAGLRRELNALAAGGEGP